MNEHYMSFMEWCPLSGQLGQCTKRSPFGGIPLLGHLKANNLLSQDISSANSTPG